MTDNTDWKTLAKDKEAWKSLRHDDPRLDAFAHEVEAKYGLPTGMVEALKNAGERTPNKGGSWAQSPVGAKGVMQFMDPTRAKFGHNPEDPFESIDAAGRYVAETMKQYGGNPMAAIADYNGGPKAANAVLKGQAPPAKETQQYLQRVRNYMDSKYGGKAK